MTLSLSFFWCKYMKLSAVDETFSLNRKKGLYLWKGSILYRIYYEYILFLRLWKKVRENFNSLTKVGPHQSHELLGFLNSVLFSTNKLTGRTWVFMQESTINGSMEMFFFSYLTRIILLGSQICFIREAWNQPNMFLYCGRNREEPGENLR